MSATVRRVATAVVAIGLIVGAFLLRRNVIEGGDDDDDPGAQPEPASALVCLTELSDVCAALGRNQPDLAITVEEARQTLDRMAAGEDIPLWLTFEPFPAMSGSLVAGEPLAASELAVATPPNRTAALIAQCAGQSLWRCIGEIAGDEWADGSGRVEPSVGNAGTSAAALASFASAVAGYFGTTDLNNTLWEGNGDFLPWVLQLVRAVPLEDLTAGTPVATMLTRPSAVNIAGTSDAEIAGQGAPPDELDSSYPDPSMWLQAVLAAPAGADVPRDLTTDAAAALLAAGWDDPGTATQPLPSATTMVALRTLWEEVAE
jgi:hypothetical protein